MPRRKRRPYGMALPPPEVPRRRRRNDPPICGTCGGPIDAEAATEAYKAGSRFVHSCGRVIYRGRSD